MFENAKAARLRPDDVAKLLKVSRVTVSLWFNGHTRPHRLLADRVERVLGAVQAAMDSGDFPVPHDITRRERGLFIQNTINKHLNPDTVPEEQQLV